MTKSPFHPSYCGHAPMLPAADKTRIRPPSNEDTPRVLTDAERIVTRELATITALSQEWAANRGDRAQSAFLDMAGRVADLGLLLRGIIEESYSEGDGIVGLDVPTIAGALLPRKEG